jgi:Bacterial EndoU nuclease
LRASWEQGVVVLARMSNWRNQLGAAIVANLEAHRLILAYSANTWGGLFGQAFRGPPVPLGTAVERLRIFLTRRAIPVATIDGIVTTMIQGSNLADPNAGGHVDLATPARRLHILEGDPPPSTHGGHRFGTGRSGKTEFPAWWTDERIIGRISDIYGDPAVQWTQRTGPGFNTVRVCAGNVLPVLATAAGNPVEHRTSVVRDGVLIRVVAKTPAAGPEICTGFPEGVGGGVGVYTNP